MQRLGEPRCCSLAAAGTGRRGCRRALRALSADGCGETGGGALRPQQTSLAVKDVLPPTHRVNAGASVNGRRVLADVAVHYATPAFWADVVTPDFTGTRGYTLVNASAGIKWRDGRMTTLVRVTNLLSQNIQQHI